MSETGTAVTKMATYHANTSQRLLAIMPDFERTTSHKMVQR